MSNFFLYGASASHAVDQKTSTTIVNLTVASLVPGGGHA